HELREMDPVQLRFYSPERPAILDGRQQLRVKRLLGCHPPRQIDVNDRLGDALFGALHSRSSGFQPEHIAEGQAQRADKADKEKFTPRRPPGVVGAVTPGASGRITHISAFFY